MQEFRASRAVAALLAVAAGATAALGFAPWDLWPLTLLGVAGLVALVDRADSRGAAAWRGWGFGVGHFAAGLTWIATAFTYQAKMPAALGWVAVVGLAMFLALYVALAAALARGLARTGAARVAVLAAAWMLGEWLRGWVFSGFAWNPLGAAWVPLPGVRGLAALGGSLGLSGLMVLAGGAVWLLVSGRGRRVGAGVLAGVALVALTGLRGDDAVRGGGPPVVLVQPNIGQGEKYRPGLEVEHLRTYLGMTAAARAGATTGALVVWSESSVPYAVEEEPEVRAALAGVLGPRDLLLFGGLKVMRDARGEVTALTNSLFVIDARGVIHGRYDKAHLVPLGEYVPLRPVMEAVGLARLTPGDIDFYAGPGPRTLALPGFPDVGVQICYEIIFPGAVVERGRRPAWLANISNDAWFGPTGPPQHLAQARLRAVEEGLPIARATPTGISAMIDARGEVVASLPLGAKGVVTTVLPPARAATVFSMLGHWVALGFGLVLLGVGLWVDRRPRRAPPPRSAGAESPSPQGGGR